MSTTQSLLDFILNLLRDSDAKAAFVADPDRALADAGLSDVCHEDVSDAMSYVSEYHPVSVVGNRDYDLGERRDDRADRGDRADRYEERHDGWRPDPGLDSHAAAVQQLEYISNNYTYTDSHDMLIDKSVNQSIWNTGVLTQRFDDHSVTAADHSVAVGGDLTGAAVTGDHNVVGDHNTVGNTTYSDNHSDDHSIRGSFDGNNVADRGGIAGDNNAGAVTTPHNSTVATNGATLDASHTDSHDRTISDSFNDSHNHTTDTTTLNSTTDQSHHTYLNSGNDQSFNTNALNHDNHNHDAYNHDSTITHTNQEGLINANITPAVNLPTDHNDIHLLSPEG